MIVAKKHKNKENKMLTYSIDFLLHILVISTFLFLAMPQIFMPANPNELLMNKFVSAMLGIIMLSLFLLLAEMGAEKIMSSLKQWMILVSLAILLVVMITIILLIGFFAAAF